VLLFVAILLFVTAVAGAAVFAARQKWLPGAWNHDVSRAVTSVSEFLPGDTARSALIWVGGIAFSAISAALTLLATWHFLEMNLPRRIEDLKQFHLQDHLALRPQLIAIAKTRLRFIPADIETSRFTLLRRWWSAFSDTEKTRLLAATAMRLGQEAAALLSAAKEAQQQAITAYLVRGYQYAAEGDNDRAFHEFEAATRVDVNDIYSRDIAAGWARCINNQMRELELLQEIQRISGEVRRYVDQARALRREAELIAKRSNAPAYLEAQERLRVAQNILEPLVADQEAKVELGRVHTLFCEVRCDRGRPGRLGGPNQPMTRMREYLGDIEMHRRPEEQCGEEYGRERVERVEMRVAAMFGDEETDGDDNAPNGQAS